MATHSIFLPGKFHEKWSLTGYSPWDHKELDMTENLPTEGHLGSFQVLALMKETALNICIQTFSWT